MNAVHLTWERDRLPDVRYATDPGDRSFDPQTESRVHERAVFAQVQIPTVGVFG